MAIIQSGATADLWTIDPTSKAGRVTLYNSSGTELGGSASPAFTKVQSGATTDVLTVDATSKAARATLYTSGGSEITAIQASDLLVTGTAASGTGVTITLPAVASKFHYITLIEIRQYAAAALTGGATPVVVTSTNLPGSVAWTFDTALAIGVSQAQIFVPTAPLKSSVANTNSVITCPATTSVIWRVNVYYFAAA